MTEVSEIKTVFLGTPQFAARVLETLVDSPYRPTLIITEPDKPVGRDQSLTPPPVKVLAEKFSIPVAQPTSYDELTRVLRKAKPNLGVVAAYGRILKPEVLTIPAHGFVNIHASLLPKYRGASPIQAAILAGDTETGVTIMEIDEGLDTGQIISWAPLSIAPDDTTPTLSEKLAELGGTLLINTLPGYLNGTIVPRPQNDADATVTKRLTKQSGQLTGHESPEQILRMLRAYTPWPGVWTEIDGCRIILHTAHVEGKKLIPDRVQLASKKPVDWLTFRRDRPQLANALEHFLNPQLL